MSGRRKVFTFVMGFIIATIFSEDIALKITSGSDKFLFFDSYTVNNVALWILLFTTVTMFFGKFKNSKPEKLAAFVSGVPLVILFVQYCRTVVLMDHYIIFSIIFCVILYIICSFFDRKKDKWQFGLFLSTEALCMALWPIGFLVYAFFSKLIGFSSGVCLVVISVLIALAIGMILEFTGKLMKTNIIRIGYFISSGRIVVQA